MDDEEIYRRAKEATRRYWDNITPEQREQRRLKAAETRRRNREIEEARWERDRKNRERAQRAAATRRRNNGTADMDSWELEQLAGEKKREYQRAYREKKKAERKADEARARPNEWRTVPGSGHTPYEFRGIPFGVLAKRNATFWAYVDQSGGPDDCWPWHGNYYYDHDRDERSKYGAAYFSRGYSTGAHRASWMLTHGFYIPGWLVVDHLCSTPWCVNPDHLEVCTQGENNRRTHHKEPEITRQSTSFDPPRDDRWHPFGRRKYDASGELKPEYREEVVWRDEPSEPEDVPEFGFGPGAI